MWMILIWMGLSVGDVLAVNINGKEYIVNNANTMKEIYGVVQKESKKTYSEKAKYMVEAFREYTGHHPEEHNGYWLFFDSDIIIYDHNLDDDRIIGEVAKAMEDYDNHRIYTISTGYIDPKSKPRRRKRPARSKNKRPVAKRM